MTENFNLSSNWKICFS